MNLFFPCDVPYEVERDLHRWSMAHTLLHPYWLSLKLQGSADEEVRVYKVPVMPIQRILKALWLCGWQQWLVSLLGPGGEEGLERYWAWALRNP